MLPTLPIDSIILELTETLVKHNCLVLRAPPGAGKTTRVPPAILDAGRAGKGQVVVLQPRRLAARAAACRIAAERGIRLGDEVGYQVRFERQAGPATRLLVVTDGLFLRMLRDDPFLERVGAVVFDEFHERSVATDMALAMVRKVQIELRSDLRIIVMSATLAALPVAAYLGNCPMLACEGRTFPVAIEYLPHSVGKAVPHMVAAAVERVLQRTEGDVLAFLPGVGEIHAAARSLDKLASHERLAVMPLYGDLPLERQQDTLRPAERRKVVLATNVAETSLTIEGITAVVDSGLARMLQFDAARGLNHLQTKRISLASADQRAGRAGRTAPGICLRLWTEREQQGLAEQELPEIVRIDLTGPVLELLAWGAGDLASLPWFEPPPAAAVERALALLERLGAYDGSQITDLGRRMAALPVQPRLARMLLEAHRLGALERGALAAALLSDRDPLRRADEQGADHTSDSDVLDRIAALESFMRTGNRHSSIGSLETQPAKFVLRVSEQLRRAAFNKAGLPSVAAATGHALDESLLRSMVAAFPDRIARRREPRSTRALMVGGRGVRLGSQSAVTEAELFVCLDLEEVGRSEALVRQASLVRREWLPAERLRITIDVEFDALRERVVAWRRTRFDDLVLDEAATSIPAGVDAGAILAREAAVRLDRSLRLDDAATEFLARVRFLQQAMPELELPTFGDDPLRELLPWLCAGRVSFDEVRKAPALAALQARLTQAQLAAVEREAPERWRAPGGSWITLHYEPGKPPVLAARIQQLFGLKQTPRVAGGRVNVLLHLLAPNMRPQQITGDLASFWMNTYPQVRKELKRRYPKHAWPDDPVTAAPQR
jgi:ATP-dependent helicase HrpB